MALVQIVKRTGRLLRLKPEDRPPVVELHLEEHERVVSFDLTEDWDYSAERKTSDWRWTAYVEVRL